MGQFETLLDSVFLIVGPCAVVYSLVSTVRTSSFMRRSIEVNGEVIRLQRSRYADRYGYTYAPVFSFTAADRETYTVTSDVGSNPPGFDVGDSVRVRYDPANPEAARIHSFFQIWGNSLVSAAVGVVFTCFACKAFGFLYFAGK